MAEFQEVIKQGQRMCKSINNCHKCPLGSCRGCIVSATYEHGEIYEQIEYIVMDWAEKHPEPQYPSWEEWQKEKFQNAGILICHGCFGKCLKKGNPNITCEHCRKQPIPADIAKKLGIKPKEGADHE